MSFSLSASDFDSNATKPTIEEVTDEQEDEQQSSTAAAAPSSSLAASSSSTSSSSPPTSSVDLNAPFHSLSTVTFAKDTNKAFKAYYKKWDIEPTCVMHKFRYLDSFDATNPSSVHSFLLSFFNDASLRAQNHLQYYNSAQRKMEKMPRETQITKPSYRQMKTNQVDLHFFDRLWGDAASNGDEAVIYGSVTDDIQPLKEGGGSENDEQEEKGLIKKCFEDVIEGITIGDELRKLVLDRDSDNYEAFSPQERQELLFVLFQHLLVGGGLNQYENSIHPYLGVLKLLYKDLLSVRTNRNTNVLEIANLVYRVEGLTAKNAANGQEEPFPLFGKKEKDRFHLCVLSVDPQKKHITMYYFAHTEAW